MPVPLCDFCGGALWEGEGTVYPVPPAVIRTPDTLVNSTGQGWLVCPPCAALVDTDRRRALAERCLSTLAGKHPELREVSKTMRLARIQPLHDYFWGALDGMRRRPGPLDAAGALARRDALLDTWQADPGRDGELARYLPELGRASILLWRADLWRAALRGQEAFVGLPLGASAGVGSQFWFIDVAPEAMEAQIRQSWELPGTAAFLGFALVEAGNAVQPAVLYESHRGGLLGAYGTVEFCPLPEQRRDGPVTAPFTAFAAGLAFCNLAFAFVEHARLPRAVTRHRRPERPEPDIRVVTLRRRVPTYRPEVPGEGRTLHEWSCSWLVAGHWRRQPYPSTGEYKPKFIAPYAKGDLSKPLKAPKALVYRVSR